MSGRISPERQVAERVVGTLVKTNDDLTQKGADHPHHIHILFCELYACSGKHWLRVLETQEDCGYHYRFIAAFFELYRDHVLRRLEDELPKIASHWRFYHWLARKLTIRSPISLHLLLVSAAARAHVRYDQGVAMVKIETELQQGSSDFGDERARLFGEISNIAQFNAALEFIDRHHERQTGWRRAVLSIYRLGLFGLKPVWLVILQRWRRKGYRDAVSNRN